MHTMAQPGKTKDFGEKNLRKDDEGLVAEIGVEVRSPETPFADC